MITLLALPTIWLANRDEDGPSSSRPNVAVIGIDPGEADDGTSSPTVSDFDPMGGSGAMYLQPATTLVPPVSAVVVVGTSHGAAVARARGTYRRSVPTGTCMYNGIRGGEDITVVNVANGRSIRCTSAPSESTEADLLVMSTTQFQKIADLTAAPIHIEVRE